MAQDNIEKITQWIDQMKGKGIYIKNTADRKKAAILSIASILGSEESKDPESLLKNVDDLVDRWAKKTNVSPSSVQPTKSHARGALQDYIQYQKDPSSLKAKKKGEKKKPKSFINGSVPGQNKHGEGEQLLPSFQLNIQIHIPADASETVIDKIFESMAKHFYQRKT
jgi:hypothetical protein